MLDLSNQKNINKLKSKKSKTLDKNTNTIFIDGPIKRGRKSRLDIDMHPELKELFTQAVIEKYGLDQYCSRRDISHFRAIETRNIIKEFVKKYGKKSRSL